MSWMVGNVEESTDLRLFEGAPAILGVDPPPPGTISRKG